MTKPTSKPWWTALGFGSSEPEPDTDYADMGTAFGLDASMSSLPAESDSSEPGSPGGTARREGGVRPR